jgi:CBS domain-containing protein
MRAIDVMVRDVVTAGPNTDVAEAIRLLAEHDFSAPPVVDAAGNLVGVRYRLTRRSFRLSERVSY